MTTCNHGLDAIGECLSQGRCPLCFVSLDQRHGFGGLGISHRIEGRWFQEPVGQASEQEKAHNKVMEKLDH